MVEVDPSPQSICTVTELSSVTVTTKPAAEEFGGLGTRTRPENRLSTSGSAGQCDGRTQPSPPPEIDSTAAGNAVSGDPVGSTAPFVTIAARMFSTASLSSISLDAMVTAFLPR